MASGGVASGGVVSGGVVAGGAYRVRPAWAEVDLAAVRHNASVLASLAGPARLCAVVKAGGYGHGAVEVARAALAGGAAWLAVALVEEGRELRAAGIAAPVLILSEPPPEAMVEVVEAGLTPTIYTDQALVALGRAIAGSGTGRPVPVHVKVDTGMHRVGATPDDAIRLAAEVAGDPRLDLEGFWTHLAVSDETANPYNRAQLDCFDAALSRLEQVGVRPRVRHASNSGATLWHPEGRYDMVRCGIALYGLSPASPGGSAGDVPDLRPAMSFRARVSFVKEVAAGERLSYGLRYQLDTDSVVATVPLGYADGVPRRLASMGATVLIGGQRRPLAGTVTMDQILVDCGPVDCQPGPGVRAGDEVVLIGRQGSESIDAWDWADRTDTIAYEVVCGISGRVPRVYLDGSWPADPTGV